MKTSTCKLPFSVFLSWAGGNLQADAYTLRLLTKRRSWSSLAALRVADNDPVERIASKQAEWKSLSIRHKIGILEEIMATIGSLEVDKVVELLGNDEAALKGFNPTSVEGKYEAMEAALTNVALIKGKVSKFLAAYKGQVQEKSLPKLEGITQNGQTVVQTLPILYEDKFSPFAKSKAEVWLKEGASFRSFDLEHFLHKNNDTGCMLVLGAGNHCFLSTIDCLHGLFHCDRTVYLKHHPLRPHNDKFLRLILEPVVSRGYFDTELDTGVERSKQLVYHPAVSRVHITGGKATHDAIVWGGAQRSQPILKAKITSELGCVTPWIVAPQSWTQEQIDHQVKVLYGALYNNAGANCNSPKVVMLMKNWPHAKEFVRKLTDEMEANPLPLSYYPGSRERWTSFRIAYPGAKQFGDASAEARAERQLKEKATVLPWLVVDDIQVDLSTEEGRKAAKSEYAFRNEPFAPVVTVAYVDSLDTAVTLSNDYLFGSLSCTVVAAESTPTVEQAIAKLRYGSIAVNTWSGFCYGATGCIWGAFPGERLEEVESGIGHIQNLFFIPDIEKCVFRSPVVDAMHVLRPGRDQLVAKTKETKAALKLVLNPGVYNFMNLVTTATIGAELPSPLALMAVMVVVGGGVSTLNF